MQDTISKIMGDGSLELADRIAKAREALPTPVVKLADVNGTTKAGRKFSNLNLTVTTERGGKESRIGYRLSPEDWLNISALLTSEKAFAVGVEMRKRAMLMVAKSGGLSTTVEENAAEF